ncbi:hypothetical protein, partial [Klebsiella pneumoniae]|uniref:hypothetical protein n=1 Tax=Klebsiella pneumoniae TaxID=573 RepID=UPI003012C535
TLTSAAKYWIVITQSSAPTGGTIALGGWTGGNKDISGNTLSAVSDIHAYYSSGAWHTGDGQTRYFQLYGLIDNNITGYSLNHRGLFVTG